MQAGNFTRVRARPPSMQPEATGNRATGDADSSREDAMTHDHREPPVCPRCGYDQSGLAAAWTSACPLRQRCSECGLDMDVARVMNPQRDRVAWFFEHVPRRRLRLLSPWRTWCRAMLPWRFWRERDGVRLDSEFSLKRLLLWLPMLVAPVWVLAAVLSSGRIIIGYDAVSGGRHLDLRDWAAIVANSFLEPLCVGYFDCFYRFQLVGSLPYFIKAWLLCCALMPMMILMLSGTRLTCRVRAHHVLRASVYGFGHLALWPVYLLAEEISDSVQWPSLLVRVTGVPWSHDDWIRAMLASGLLGIAWFAAWWYIVIVRVFRLRHAHGVWLLLMIACTLVFAIMAVIENGLEPLLTG